jgi:flavodoxin
MNILIVYDSQYGNTAHVAQELAREASKYDNVRVVPSNEANNDMLVGTDMLIVGSPTHGGRPTPTIRAFLKRLPDLNSMQVGAFDTRLDVEHSDPLRAMFMRFAGFAAQYINHKLITKGGMEVLQPQGFIVDNKAGPLRDDQIARAVRWISNAHRAYQPAPA